MPIILGSSNAPVAFSGQIAFYDSGTPVRDANITPISYSSSNAPIAFSGQEVIH